MVVYGGELQSGVSILLEAHLDDEEGPSIVASIKDANRTSRIVASRITGVVALTSTNYARS